MRLALSMILGLALCLPATAQRGGFGGRPGGPGGPGGRFERPQPTENKEVEELKAVIRALEAKLKAATESKKPEEGKLQFVIVTEKEEKKEVEKKPEVVKKPDPVKKPDGKKKEEPKKPEAPRGPGGFGPPMGGRGGFGPPMGVRGGIGGFGRGPGEMNPPGFEKLTEDEKQTFRRLMEKMMGGDRRPEGPQPPMGGRDRRPEGPQPPMGDRRPSMEERMERLERMIEDLRRGMQNRR